MVRKPPPAVRQVAGMDEPDLAVFADAFAWLVEDYGFVGPEFRPDDPAGPVVVEISVEAREATATVTVVALRNGAYPVEPPIMYIPVELLVQIRSPEDLRDYPSLINHGYDLVRMNAYVRRAAEDLRTFGDDLLRGSMAAFDEERSYLKDTPGVPGVDWWVDDGPNT